MTAGAGVQHATARLHAAVALGSMIGGTARWLASELIHGWFGAGFPWGTLFVNASGSFLIGCCAALWTSQGRFAVSPVQRHFMMAGVCGGYTTFSIFSIEAIHLLGSGETMLAVLHVVGSTFAWLLAVWSGYTIVMRLTRSGSRQNDGATGWKNG